MIYLELLLAFLQVGLFTFGGGYGAVPLIRDVVMSHGWLSEESLAYMIAVSESTPGPIMVNMATYVGSTQAGLPGALVATIAVVLPSFCIILAVTALMKTVVKNPYVQAVLSGLKPAIIGIICATGLSMVLRSWTPGGSIDWSAVVMTVLLAAALLGSEKLGKRKLSPVALIGLAALLGILIP